MNLNEIQLTEEESDPKMVKVVVEGLRGYNRTYIGDSSHTPVIFTFRDDAGSVVGGILGEVGRDWLFIAVLWVASEFRGHGLGSRLLQAAESKAQAEGATKAHLDTFSFQAPEFYRRHGFEEFGRIKAYQAGYDRIYMQKQLG